MSAYSTAGNYRRLTQEDADAICAKHDRLWTARPGGARAVFSWMDLSGLNFRGRNLSDADFTGAILVGCKFANARLDHAVFFGADMQEADFSESSLRRADLRGACLRGADLTGADLFEADLREGSIAAVDRGKGLRLLEHTSRVAEAQGATLAGANLERSKLSGVIAVRADFTDAILKDAKLVRANLKQASMSGANLAGADLSGADLSGADLRDAVLVGRDHLCLQHDRRAHGRRADRPAIGPGRLRAALRRHGRRPRPVVRDRGSGGHAFVVRRRRPARAEEHQGLQSDRAFGQGRRLLRPRHGRRAAAGRPPRRRRPARLQPAPRRPARRAADGRQALRLGSARGGARPAADRRRPRCCPAT